MTDFKVALAFEDGVTRFITVADDQSVADAAYRQRINIPVDCNDGACGTCKAFCESGDYDPGFYVEDALTEDEASKGYLLACQAKPQSDLVLQINSTSAVAKTQTATYTGTVTDVHRYSDNVMRLRMTIPNRDKLAYLPGQYVNIHVPGSDETRSYSFSNDPGTEELEFLVKIIPGGLMSTWLSTEAKVGDEVTFTGPHGSFFLREAHRPVLMVAGGTGLAPMLSMLRTVAASDSSRTIHLVYGANTDAEAVELETLEALTSEIKNFTWDHCIADPKSSAKNTGYVMGIIAAEHLHAGDAAVYLCGPPPMVEAVRTHFDNELGIEPTGFYYEKFTSAVPARKTDPVQAPVVGTIAEETDATPVEPQTPAAEPATRGVAASAEQALAGAAAAADFEVGGELITAGEEARSLLGISVFAAAELDPAPADAAPATEDEQQRFLLGQELFDNKLDGERRQLDADRGDAPDQGSRDLLGELVFPTAEVQSVGGAEPAGIAAQFVRRPGAADEDQPGDGYEIGEEHPSILKSDAIFEARQALELGALELVLGRIGSGQLAGYRILAEATLPYVQGDRFVDAMAYTETNAAFHDYLFTLTGNDHLRQAYQRLGVKGAMEETLRNATWCHPLCAKDHVDMVDAIEAGQRDRARQLFMAHADRSKLTMRRAMQDQRKQPANISPGRFAGKVVLVTGAAQGIGEAVARRIHAEGGELVLADRSELVESLAEELGRTESAAVAQLADLETYAGAQSVVDKAIRRFGRVDVAIHVVGGTIWRKPYEKYAEDEITAEINRSLYPTLWGCRAVLPHLYEQGHGTIVNVSSVATMGLNRLPYAAAKGGVNAITRSLAFEAAPHGVRVVATAPGGTDAPPRRIPRGGEPQSDQEQQWHQVTVDQTLESSLLKRYGTLDEQAAAICFLASDEASYLTGQVLPVGGGDLG
ncbi:1,6-dihydroxycyclohexa-2,4-diene-1-carboxylate dehydrogenase [Naumannella sp. ID2617S]|nr:1,6-dihydroxycyclohexa-2,4-diene-1-carboxylate dehydrogenase [Naumannella sp. ID2617S]